MLTTQPSFAESLREQHIDAALESLWPEVRTDSREALERLYDQALSNTGASTRALRAARAT